MKRMRVVPVTSARSADLGYSGFSQDDTSIRAGVPKARGAAGGAGGAITTGAGGGGTELAVIDGCGSAGGATLTSGGGM